MIAIEKHRNSKLIGTKIPLAPAYAITAHSSQGRTLAAAIIDLQLGRGVNRIASYVAMTRVRKRTDLLVYRPLDRELFTQGPPSGPSLLLKHLRGDRIDWTAIEDEHVPKRKCHGTCGLVRFKEDFGAREWKNKQDPHCTACMRKLTDAGTPWRCARCRKFCAEKAFCDTALSHQTLQRRVCSECANYHRPRRCHLCACNKEEHEFHR